MTATNRSQKIPSGFALTVRTALFVPSRIRNVMQCKRKPTTRQNGNTFAWDAPSLPMFRGEYRKIELRPAQRVRGLLKWRILFRALSCGDTCFDTNKPREESSLDALKSVRFRGRRKFRVRRRGRLEFRFARGRRPQRFACLRNQNICGRSPANRRG